MAQTNELIDKNHNLYKFVTGLKTATTRKYANGYSLGKFTITKDLDNGCHQECHLEEIGNTGNFKMVCNIVCP